MTEKVSREQAAQVAKLVRTIRPSWDELAIINALGKVKGRDLDEVTAAAINAANDKTIHTPLGITFDGPHWPRQSDSGGLFREPKCFICGHTRSECRKRRDLELQRGIPDPHEFETKDDADRLAARRQMEAR